MFVKHFDLRIYLLLFKQQPILKIIALKTRASTAFRKTHTNRARFALQPRAQFGKHWHTATIAAGAFCIEFGRVMATLKTRQDSKIYDHFHTEQSISKSAWI